MIIRLFRAAMLTAIISTILLSCTREPLSDSGSQVVTTFKIGSRALDASDPDSKITKLRVIAFDRMSGNARVNKLYVGAELPDVNPISFEILTGNYDFVFIANEPDENTVALNAITRETALDGVVLATGNFREDEDIPMYKRHGDVTIAETGVSGTDVNFSDNRWNVALDRLAVKFTVTVIAKDGSSAENFGGIHFTNLPEGVMLTGGDYGGNYDDTWSDNNNREYSDSDFEETIPAPSGADWSYVQTARIILPSNMFADASNEDRAIVLEAIVGGKTYRGKLGIDPQADDYTLPNYIMDNGERKSCHYNVTFTLERTGGAEVYIQAAEWTDQNVNADPLNRMLNVSVTEATVTDISAARIYFWSNQQNVFVEEEGYEETSETETFIVNEFFNDLSGTSAANIHYNDATKSTGYIDIYSTQALPGNYTRRIFLNAGGLLREITVNATIPTSPVEWGTTPWIGTFHRNNEVGERVIYAGHSGAWSAEVMDDYGQDFVVVSSTPSYDPNLKTDSPGDPEKYPVTDGKKMISGNGRIYFRVGMKNKNTTGSNRYDRIKLSWNDEATTKESIIWVRQGEDADYVMQDGDAGGNITGGSRLYAKQFSPYNLTHADLKSGASPGGTALSGHPQVTQRSTVTEPGGTGGGVFVDYPTQAGAFFQWAGYTGRVRYAFHPVSPVDAFSDWVDNFPSTYWNTLGATHETCPPGYRRPTDGTLNNNNNGSTVTYVDQLAQSEMRQSLYLNPKTYTASSIDNSVWGYYADGFFDRRKITESAVGTSFPNSTVSKYSADVAYIGRLFFNPNTNASLFLPAAGYRDSSNGKLNGTGYNGNYWSSSSFSSTTSWLMSFYHPSVIQGGIRRSNGYSVRCVSQ